MFQVSGSGYQVRFSLRVRRRGSLLWAKSKRRGPSFQI